MRSLERGESGGERREKPSRGYKQEAQFCLVFVPLCCIIIYFIVIILLVLLIFLLFICFIF